MNTSLIIPTYNRPESLSQTLTAVAQLEHGPDEIIVVDDGSILPYNLSPITYNLRHVRQAHRGQAAALNTGIRASRHEICCFLDDDCVPEPDWLAHLLVPFTDPDILGVSGAIHYVQPNFRPRPGDRVVHNPTARWPMSGNIAFRHEILYRVGGFDVTLPAYCDKDLALKVWRYGQIKAMPQARVWHAHERWNDEKLQTKTRHASVWVILANRHDLTLDRNNPPPIRFGLLFPKDYIAVIKHLLLIPLFTLAGIFNQTARRRATWEQQWVRFLINQRRHIWRENMRHNKIFL